MLHLEDMVIFGLAEDPVEVLPEEEQLKKMTGSQIVM
jgi:hypothetical protein